MGLMMLLTGRNLEILIVVNAHHFEEGKEDEAAEKRKVIQNVMFVIAIWVLSSRCECVNFFLFCVLYKKLHSFRK